MKKSIKAILSVVLALVLGATVFIACESKHEHGFSEEWTHDETGHWYACTGENCEEKGEFAAHVYDNDADTTCNVCGYARAAHVHAADTAWSKDATNHWHECTVSGCNEQLDKAAHTWDEGTVTTEATFTNDGEKTYACTVCQKTKTETVTMDYIDVNFVKSDAENQTKVRFTVTEAGAYYFRYEVQDCGFANGYYWINMNKVGGTLQQTDTNHAQARIYDANKQLVKEGLYTQAAGQFMAVDEEDAQTRKGLMDNGVKYLEMPFVTPGEYEMIVTHYAGNYFSALDYNAGSFSKAVTLWSGYSYYSITLTDEMLAGGYYGTDLRLGASPATGLTWQFVDADGNPVEKKEGDTDTYYSAPAAGTYYIVIYSATKQTGVTVSASLLAACDGSPAAPNGTLESKNGVTVEGTFADGAALEAVEVVGADKILALQSIAEEKYDTDGEVYVYDISLIKDGAKVQPSGKVKVTVSVPDIDTSKTYTVYHVKDDGAVEKIKPTVQNGTVSFETESFSCFIIAPDEESGGETEQPKKQVNVSINILPLAECGMLKVNGTLYENAASYKTTHTEGERITVEAIATSGHHFGFWGEDEVLSREPVYEFTVGAENISFAANFTGHDVQYSEITDDAHTEKCKFGDYTATVAHTFANEKIITEATCQYAGEKELSCVCGKTKTEEIPITDHDYQDGVCSKCGKTQTYVRVNANGVANPNGAYIKMGKTYCEQVKDGNLENALMEKAGSPYLTLENWTPFDFGNGDSGENATTYYCDVEYNGLNYRGVYIKDYRKDNDSAQTTNSRYWTGTYWFEQRIAMWEIVKIEDGKAYLVSKEIWISQRFAESDEGELTYENSWIRSWLINTWINELFTPAQQAILQGNEACFGDKIFLPSSDEISINNPKPFGLYRYPFCLGAYKEVLQGYSDNYCPYWLRDGIVKGDDGKNYVTCVTSCPPFDQTTKYLATKTFVGVVPAIIIEL